MARCWSAASRDPAAPRRWPCAWRVSPTRASARWRSPALHATAGDLRTRAEEAAREAFEELAVHPHRVAAVRLLREHSTEAGVDPFLESLNAAERLAMLLDRVDELPLRRHEIRGNAAGLLARLIGRIDALKAAAVDPGALPRLGRRADARGIRRRRARLRRARARVRRALRDPRLRPVRGRRDRRWLGRPGADAPARRATGARGRDLGALSASDRRRARGRLPGGASADRAAREGLPNDGALLRRRTGPRAVLPAAARPGRGARSNAR